MLLDRVTGEPQTFDHASLDFSATKTVAVKKDLYAFKDGSPVSAYKISNIPSNDYLVTPLPSLPNDVKLKEFAVAYWALRGSIVLTGGYEREGCSAQTFMMAVQMDRWQHRLLPALNVARSEHASMSLGHQVYVACGIGNDGYLRSVEMLRRRAQSWVIIEIPDLYPR